MARFTKRPGDLIWGKYNYPVTPTQHMALEGIWWLLRTLPRAIPEDDLPAGAFYSQNSNNGTVIIGIHHHSVSVYRSGRVKKNQ